MKCKEILNASLDAGLDIPISAREGMDSLGEQHSQYNPEKAIEDLQLLLRASEAKKGLKGIVDFVIHHRGLAADLGEAFAELFCHLEELIRQYNFKPAVAEHVRACVLPHLKQFYRIGFMRRISRCSAETTPSRRRTKEKASKDW